MPDARTEVTEIVTALGMMGYPNVSEALDARPASVRNVDTAVWERLRGLLDEGRFAAEFDSAWSNGAAFLRARAALRGRVPRRVEWTGGQQSPGDEVVPADLRVDHVYLISCKYQSSVLRNGSPSFVFERLLRGGHGLRGGGNWYSEVATEAHQALYEVVRDQVGDGLDLPDSVDALTTVQRRGLKHALQGDWSETAGPAYLRLCEAVAAASAPMWRDQLRRPREQEAFLWRLLRIGSAPYYVLGTSGKATMRLRVPTPWEWRQAFSLQEFTVTVPAAGQPKVGWKAVVRRKADDNDVSVEGHVEIRWSHGRFRQPPEAKVYLDTPHHDVPGYHALE